jgi:hypothetical protein
MALQVADRGVLPSSSLTAELNATVPSAIAVTTVGFGDLSPTTDVTKLFTVFYVVVGISLTGVVLNERLRRHADRVHRRRSSIDE